jgi:hypothetical protein
MPARRRGTQSLLDTLAWCWRHPSLLGVEVAWRWVYGIPVLWVLWRAALALAALVPPEQSAQLQAVQMDPVKASAALAPIADVVLPVLMQKLEWMVPALLAAWAVASGVGRWLVLRRLARLQPELVQAQQVRGRLAGRLMIFQLLRGAGLAAAFWFFFVCIHTGANAALEDIDNPNLVLYFTVVIVAGLGTFTVWALVSWALSVAPVVSLIEGRGVWSSLWRGVRLPKGVTGKLVEMNLVLGIVKLALLVLAMVFSAVPMPFESVVPPEQLHAWWAIVTVLYFVANDYFQVVRLTGMVEFCRAGGVESSANEA